MKKAMLFMFYLSFFSSAYCQQPKAGLYINSGYHSFYLLAAGIALCILASILISRRRISHIRAKEEQKTALNKRIAELELQALKARMNPHFIFNTINSIQHYIVKNNQEKAFEYLSKYSRLMRKIFDYSSKSYIIVTEEIETLNLYLELESLRLNNKFSYKIETDTEVDIHFEKIPPLLIQPFVENAIWHGLMGRENDGGFLKVLFRLHDEKTLLCEIQDNGIGRAKAEAMKGKNRIKHEPGGMAITGERLEILNKAAGNNLRYRISDLVDNNGIACGTRIIVFIPFKS